jgi:hypothetical protein
MARPNSTLHNLAEKEEFIKLGGKESTFLPATGSLLQINQKRFRESFKL